MSDMNLFAGLLRTNSKFRDSGDAVQIEYRTNADDRDYLRKYRIRETAGAGTDFERAARLLQWVAAHIVHNGNFDNHIAPTAPDLLAYAYDQGAAHGINCRCLAALLTECLLACGMKARTVYLFPMSPYDCDNHVVTEVYASELAGWVMLDPTYGLYLMTDKRPMSIAEIRSALAARKRPGLNPEAHYNGNPVDPDALFDYYAKDFYSFQVLTVQAPAAECDPNACGVHIVPEGYDVAERVLANMEYRGSVTPEQLAQAAECIRSIHFICKDLQFLYGE